MFRSAVFVCACASVCAGQRLQVVDTRIPEFTPDGAGNASIVLTLRSSPAGAKVPLRLSIADFEHQGPNPYKLNTAATFEGVGAKLPDSVGDAGVPVKISVTHLWEAGEATAALRSGDEDVVDSLGHPVVLRAIRVPASYNVHFETENPVVPFRPDAYSRPSVRLVNHDAMNYTFTWKLVPQGETAASEGKTVVLPANGKVDLDLSSAPSRSGWIEAGTLRANVVPADLILEPQLVQQGSGPALAPQPAVILPLKMRILYWSWPWQGLWELLVTAIFLTLGALASLWLRVYIPNATTAIRLRRRLDGLRQKIEGVGTDLPSHWRVLLLDASAQQRRALKEMWWAFPAFTQRLVQLQESVEMCAQWVEIGYAVSVVLNRTEKLSQSGIAPTLRELITRKCEDAMRPMATGFTTAEELQAMKAALASAQSYLFSVENGAAVVDLEALLKAREDEIDDAMFTLLSGRPRFKCMLDNWERGKPFKPERYRERDIHSLKAHLLRHYGLLLAERCCVAADGTEACKGGACQRLKDKEAQFFCYLDTDSYQSLRMAQIFAMEMAQDFYPDALLSEKDKLEVHAAPRDIGVPKDGQEPENAQPARIVADAAVRFSLRFKRAALNETAALQEWTCYWTFGDGGECESGWDVFHAYEESGSYKVTIRIVDLAGNELAVREQMFSVKAARKGSRHWLHWRPSAEARVEASRLLFALAIALAGVYAAARTQVESMGVLNGIGALIALGFGVEIVKNVLTQSGDTGGKTGK